MLRLLLQLALPLPPEAAALRRSRLLLKTNLMSLIAERRWQGSGRQQPDPRSAGSGQGHSRQLRTTVGPWTTNYLRFQGGEHVVVGGTIGNDTIITDFGDDGIWGDAGDDRIESGAGVDLVNGGGGNDIITDSGDTGDFLKGDEGDDVIANGNGLDIFMGGDGQRRRLHRRRCIGNVCRRRATTSSSAATALT